MATTMPHVVNFRDVPQGPQVLAKPVTSKHTSGLVGHCPPPCASGSLRGAVDRTARYAAGAAALPAAVHYRDAYPGTVSPEIRQSNLPMCMMPAQQICCFLCSCSGPFQEGALYALGETTEPITSHMHCTCFQSNGPISH